MKCEKCGINEATTHIRSITNGVIREYNLCSGCAMEKGYTSNHNSLTGMLSSLFGEFLTTSASVDTKKCPVCSATFNDIAKSGKAGCTECYSTFREELLPYLKRVHGSTKHIGHVPNNAPIMVVKQQDTVDSLRMELNRLVREEKYEEAAIIRDKIKKLEGKENE
ncbi:MAG: UvrB/UvrC motif-containing protein [Clostridia bacterium]|nr:UvrB/UvrC motif-containing protein [Clostridia bacterium]